MALLRVSIALLVSLVLLQSESLAQRNIFSSPTADFFKRANSANRFSTRNISQGVYQAAIPVNVRGATNDIFSNALPSRPRSKPFSNVQQQSNLSPYLNLGGLPTGAVPNYHTQVRPQLEQQRNQAQRSQIGQRNQQAQAAAARAPYELRGASDIMPTGHAATYQNLSGRFMNYGGYYRQ